MGAKYLPNIKDLKAMKRFQQKQTHLPRAKPPAIPTKAKPGASQPAPMPPSGKSATGE
jgi:hypothetical protein